MSRAVIRKQVRFLCLVIKKALLKSTSDIDMPRISEWITKLEAYGDGEDINSDINNCTGAWTIHDKNRVLGTLSKALEVEEVNGWSDEKGSLKERCEVLVERWEPSIRRESGVQVGKEANRKINESMRLPIDTPASRRWELWYGVGKGQDVSAVAGAG